MIDLKKVRENVEGYKRICQLKQKNIDVDMILSLDDQRKDLQKQVDETKFAQKKAGDAKDFERAKSLKEEIQPIEEKYNQITKKLDSHLLECPNFIHPSVPEWKDEDENVVVKKVWTPKSFDFPILDHQTIGEKLWMIDKQKASEVTWARFFYLKWDIALLQYALINFTFSVLTNESTIKDIIETNSIEVSSKPFQVVVPPVMIKYSTAEKMWRLEPKEDRYCIEEDQLMFIGSAEHSLWPILMDETIPESQLPIRYVACTPSFRREAWTYGKDTTWILRTHQFDKIEMETFTTSEEGLAEQDFIVAIQEYLISQLQIPYQKVMICTGDMWAIDYRQFDMECWIPSQEKYRETHTSDYMTDFQARRLNIKTTRNNGDREYIHMNDATAFALWRILIAIIENNQQADGSIKIPDVLVPYMGKQYIGK